LKRAKFAKNLSIFSTPLVRKQPATYSLKLEMNKTHCKCGRGEILVHKIAKIPYHKKS
jgi:hypothetical protein